MTLLTGDGANGSSGSSGGDGGGSAAGGGNGAGGVSGNGAPGAGSQGGAGSSSGSSGGSSTSGGNSSWRDALPEDLRGNATLSKFQDLPSLAKAHVELQSFVGKKGVFPPGQNATPEQWKDFFKQAGQPEFEKFELKLPDGKPVNAEAAAEFRKMAHDLGLLPHQAQGLLDWQIGKEESIQSSSQTQSKAQREIEMGDLKKEWGDGYDKEMKKAQAAIKELGGERLQKYLLKTGLGDDLELARFAAKAGALLGEDKLRGQGGGGFGQTPAELQEEINRTLGDKTGPYWNKNHPSHKDAVRAQEERYRRLSK